MKGLWTLALGALIVGTASADFTFDGTSTGQSLSVSGTVRTGNFFAGKLKFTDSSYGYGSIKTFCVDLVNTIPGNPWDTLPPQFSTTLASPLKEAGNMVAAYFGAADTNAKAQSMQAAIWEALYDGGAVADFSSGNFQASNVADLAFANLVYSARGTDNDAIYWVPDPLNAGQAQMSPVPEPASMIGLLLGLGAVAGRRLRKT
ncbi:MAG: PEP-CTERM sorting domain-containing protein [Fimbriimonadaceae bacterium]|nr:PEP-CTERM sorting domain-containing protein [Fimbriimonadaceae bacterium]